MDKLSNNIWKSLKNIQTTTQPLAIFMMGIPASGKSSSIEVVLEDLSLTREDFIHIDPDIFMTSMRGYDNSKASQFNKSGVIISSQILK